MHKRIGIIGGMSPESTVAYYEYLTHTYTERYGDHGYPEILIYSVSFQDYVNWPQQERWDLVASGLIKAAHSLEAAGAEVLLIATNTMHIVFDQVQASVRIPMLNLLETVGDAIQARGLATVGLLGTKFTMEKDFYREALSAQGIRVLIPEAQDRQYVHSVIYEELVAGKIRDDSRSGFVSVIDRLAERGAQGMILGCTEIPLLITEQDAGIPLFDTTAIHAEAALRYAVGI